MVIKESVREAFEHLREELSKCYPEANVFNEGASSLQIGAVEEHTGWKIPVDLKSLLEIANGQPDSKPGGFGGLSFLSTDLMIHCYDRWCELVDYRTRPPLEESIRANPHIGSEYSAYPHWCHLLAILKKVMTCFTLIQSLSLKQEWLAKCLRKPTSLLAAP